MFVIRVKYLYIMINHRFRILSAMIMREMTTRYGRSAGGYIWAILEPVAFIMMFVLIFSQITRDPAIGRSFALFFATGVIAFTVYRDISDSTSGSFIFNKALFTYPHVTIVDAILARFILQLITQIFVAIIVFTGIFLFEDIKPQIKLSPIMLAISIAALTGLSVGVLNCTLFVFSPTWQRLFNLLNRPLFLISGIFFTPEMFPESLRSILLFNPLVHVVGLMRKGFYPTYEAPYINFPYMVGLPLVLMTLGLLIIRRTQGRLLEQ